MTVDNKTWKHYEKHTLFIIITGILGNFIYIPFYFEYLNFNYIIFLNCLTIASIQFFPVLTFFISLYYFSKTDFIQYIKSKEFKHSIIVGLIASLLIYHLCYLGCIYLGWDHSLENFINQKISKHILDWSILILISDLGFYLVHYVIHKGPELLRIIHSRHHECDLNNHGCFCTFEENHVEMFFRDYMPIVVGTLVISIISFFNIWTLCFYYLFYSFWSFWSHTLHNKYHYLHHELYNCNYGIFGIFDFLFNTLILNRKHK